MSTKRTVIKADEELVIKGKLTIEGNVTQIETTQQVTNLEGNVFTINSDGSDTSAVLVLNSNGTEATLTFDDASGSIAVNKPIIFTSGNVTAPIFIGNVIGNVTGFVSSISNFTTTNLTEGANLYYTIARANAAIDARLPNTDSLSEGASNLYYTVARANTAIDARLSGGDGIDYTSGVIDVDSTVVRTSGNQSISGEKTFTGQINLTADVIPTSANTYDLGSWTNHFGNVFANVVHAERLDLGDADLSDIHSTFYAGTPTGTILDTNTAGGLTYAHNSPGDTNPGGYYRVNTGDGLEIDGNAVAVDNTVIRTTGGQTINGNLTLTGNLVVVNIDSQTQTDSVVNDKVLYLNVGGGASPNNSRLSIEKTAANVYLEYDSRWKFTNDGANVNNMLLFTDFSAGNGLSFDNAGEYSAVAGDGITIGSNIAVDSSVVRTTGDQSIAGIKSFTGELVVPLANSATSNNAIYVNPSANSCYVVINGFPVQLTADSDVGQVEDVGTTGINIYAGFRTQPVDNVDIVYHGIKSIDGGTYTSLSEASNVITVDANITSIRSAFSAANIAGYGGIGYDSANGVFNYSGVTDSQIRGLFSGTGLISYNSGTGAITTTADNYGSWTVQTDSGAGAAESISSTETLTIQGGTNITVTNAGNVITITNDNSADITGVSAGNGLTGGGSSGAVTLTVGAGPGITVNADNVALASSTAGNGLTYTSGVLAVGAGTGITVNANDIAISQTSVVAGSYGSPSKHVTFSVDAQGRLTAASQADIAIASSQVSGLAASATTDTTNASNITSGTLASARLPDLTVADFAGAAIQTSAEAYADSDTVLMTAAAIDDRITSYGYSTTTGTVTSVSGGNGLTGTVTASGSLEVGAGPGITVNADNVALTSGIITTGAKTYGTASSIPSITVDTYGRVTAISNTSISITASQVSDFTTAANTAIDNRIVGGNGLTYASGTLAVGAGSYITVAADTVGVDATTAATASKVVARDGAGNVYANVFVGVSTSARYADLAENYLADAEYAPGTVLVFGGSAEVTACVNHESTKVAGVVTTNPAHVMNSDLTGPNVACIALRGRVPVLVKGVARKGDVLVTAGEGKVGYAVASMDPRNVPAAAIVGKVISDKLDPGLGTVEALI